MVDVVGARQTVTNMFEQIIALFVRIFTEFGAWDWFFGAFTIFIAYRFLLVPMLGGSAGSSDKVKKSKGEKGSENND